MEYLNTIDALWKVTKVILDTLDFNEVTQKICDSLLTELDYLKLGYRIVVLSLYKPEAGGLQRISLSQTPEAEAAVSASTVPFHDIVIPITAVENLCAKAFVEQTAQITHDWKDILSPPMKPDDARVNQAAAGIKTSMVYPVIVRGKSVGVVILSMIKDEAEVTEMEKDLIRGFAEIVGIAVQNAQLYQDLDRANQKLKELDKLKDEFVSLASHELRTPMTAIKSYAWMIMNAKENKLDPKNAEYMQIIFDSTERLIAMINDMLDLSRIESGKITLKRAEFDLMAMTVKLKEMWVAKLAEKKLDLQIVSSGEKLVVNGDEEKILQVLENLVGNAVKFTPDGGKITVKLAKKPNEVEIAVSDTGPGIAPEDKDKLFKKFGRLDNSLTSLSKTGTGLGLYLAKQYVQMHGGEIGVESELGHGATFRFSIPNI